MRPLWAPWRIEYITAEKSGGCLFCEKHRENQDEANLILYRGRHNFSILNRYPYSPGHLMIAPYLHRGDLNQLETEELLEHFDLVRKAVALLQKVLKPAGFNIGLNLGKVAGAGVEDHIHTHVVPRWEGDTNFMPVIADTRVVPEALRATLRKLKEKIAEMQG